MAIILIGNHMQLLEIYHQLIEESRILKKSFKSTIYEVDPNTIKKIFHNDEWGLELLLQYFPDRPDLFPKIFEINDTEITMEKLNTSKAKTEYNKLQKYFKSNHHMSAYAALFGGLNSSVLVKLHPSTKLPDDIKSIYIKFRTLIENIMTYINNPHFLLDIHADNFGYDADGNLKMLDI